MLYHAMLYYTILIILYAICYAIPLARGHPRRPVQRRHRRAPSGLKPLLLMVTMTVNYRGHSINHNACLRHAASLQGAER